MAYIKLLHVLFVFIWVGALLSITRLMAYQVKETAEVQFRMARICKKTYFFVDLPSMILAIGLLGISLLYLKGPNWKAGWLHMKLTFAFLLVICDLIVAKQILNLAKDPTKGKAGLYKILHSAIGLLLIGVLVAIYVVKQKAS